MSTNFRFQLMSAVSNVCIASVLPQFVDALPEIYVLVQQFSCLCGCGDCVLCCGVMSSLGGGEGWVGRPIRVLVDMFRARERLVLAAYVVFGCNFHGPSCGRRKDVLQGLERCLPGSE